MDIYDNYENEDIDGLIQRIQVKNFLCHDNLIIDFSSNNINWIVGRNGSGKSAIITALIVGLGGKAAATSRGNNFQSFIKRGTNSATVEIKIKNSGRNAYNHAQYGNHITVIRTITISGGSNYTVKSASGEVVSRKFAEVKNIILALEIQVDNPISVLNQDDARTLCAIDPQKLYSLFKRATNLDHSQSNYQKVIENCKKAIEIKNDKEKTCAHLKRECQEWESKHRRLSSRTELKRQIRSLENEIAWSDISVLKRERDALREQIEQQNTKCRKITEKIMSMDQDFGNNRNIIETLMNRLEECNNTKTALEREKKNMELEFHDITEKLRSAQQATAKKREKLDKEMRKVADFEREISNIESGGSLRRRDELERAAAEAHAALEAAAARVSTAEHREEQARAQHERAQADARRRAADERDARERLDRLRVRQREMKARQGEPLAVWGARIVELRRRIDEAVKRREFTKPPVGPVGHYLRLTDQRWANALEHIIGKMKTTFCVNSPADTRKLFEIMQEVYGSDPKPSVTCSRFQEARHDVSPRRVRAQPAALDVLDVPHPVVANFLIDNLSLETVLLVPDQERAIRLSDTEENVPVNCSKIVTEDCTEFYPAPNYRSYGAARRPSQRYLQLRTEDVERALREDARAAEEALRAAAEGAQGAARAAARAADELADAEAELRALLHARRDCEQRRRAAAGALDKLHSPQSDELEKELNISKQIVETLKLEVDEAASLVKKHDAKINEYRNNMDQIKAKLNEAAANARSLNAQIAQEQSKVDDGAARRENYERKLKEVQEASARMQEKLTQFEAKIADKVTKALNNGASVENPRERKVLEEQLLATSSELRDVNKMQLDEETVRGELARTRTEYTNLRDLLDSFGELINEIETCIEKRLKFCYKLEIQITRRVQYCFQSNLATHGYYGRIAMRHSSGELELELSARDGRGGARPVAALSGGERSYCTVALLLALWECVELPFYFLDEFDVYLDEVNRRIVVELLLDFARRRSARQFVLLSPAAPHANALAPPARLQVHRLDDPRP